MAGPARHPYGTAGLLALAWVAGAVLVAFGVAWWLGMSPRNDERLPMFQRTTLVAMAGLPFVAGGVHRSLRVLTMTALLEAVLLGGLGMAGFMAGNG